MGLLAGTFHDPAWLAYLNLFKNYLNFKSRQLSFFE